MLRKARQAWAAQIASAAFVARNKKTPAGGNGQTMTKTRVYCFERARRIDSCHQFGNWDNNHYMMPAFPLYLTGFASLSTDIIYT